MAMGTDRNWLVCGTSRGYIGLWDVRYQVMAKLYRHECKSSINRLATCFTRLPQESNADVPRPYVFVAAGANEAAVFDVGSGACAQAFKVLGRECAGMRGDSLSRVEGCRRLPRLEDVALPSRVGGSVKSAVREAVGLNIPGNFTGAPCVRALMGRISERTGSSYLVTGSSDRKIIHWDFTSPSKCYGVSGYEGGDKMSVLGLDRRLFVSVPNGRGQAKATAGAVRPSNAHRDAVLDLKSLDRPRAMLSSGADGVVKVWR